MQPWIYGAVCTFGAHFAAGGKNEIEQIYMAGLEQKTPLGKEPSVECTGRLLAYFVEASSAALAGGLLVPALQRGVSTGDPTTRWYCRILLLGWFGVVMGALCFLNGKMPHTTRFTRMCVHMVERLVQSP